MEMLCVGNMASGPFTSGYAAYKKTYTFQFDKAHMLKIKKLKERLDRNLDWEHYHEFVFRRLSAQEIIFRERQHQFLARSGPQILYSQLLLDPANNQFTIIGRLSKTTMLAYPIIAYVISSKADHAVEAFATFVAVILFFVLLSKIALSKYYAPRYLEFANAVMDVLEEPNKSFKYAPYRSRDLTNRSAP